MFSAYAGIMNNVIGVFYGPVSESLGFLRGSFALHQTIMTVAFGVFSLWLPKIINRFGRKKSLTFGLILSFIGTIGMAFASHLGMFYLLGAIRGIGGSFFGLVPMAMIINNWFYEKNGFAMSLASGISGLVGMIFAPIFSGIIAHSSRQRGFIIMGIVVSAFALPAILVPYKLNPKEEGLLPYGGSDHAEAKEEEEEVEGDISVSNNRYARISFIAMIIFSLLHTNILGINQHMSSYGESIGMSLELSGYMLSAVMLGNIVFKLLIGPLSDKLDAVKATIIMNGVNTAGLLIMIFTKSQVLTIFAAFLFGSVFGVGSVALPLLSNQFFGKDLSERVFPVLTLTSSIGSALSNTLAGYIFDFTGSYAVAFFIAVAFQLINLLMLFIANRYSVAKK